MIRAVCFTVTFPVEWDTLAVTTLKLALCAIRDARFVVGIHNKVVGAFTRKAVPSRSNQAKVAAPAIVVPTGVRYWNIKY